MVHKEFIFIPEKNRLTGVILTVLFGPFGLLYSGLKQGLVWISFGLLITFLVGLFGGFLVWVASISWSAFAVDDANERTRINRLLTFYTKEVEVMERESC